MAEGWEKLFQCEMIAWNTMQFFGTDQDKDVSFVNWTFLDQMGGAKLNK